MQKLSIAGSFTLLAVACLTIMVGCVIVPGLPSIARELGIESGASWLVTVPSLGVILFGPLAGKLIERQGLYRALCLGLFSYGLLGWGGSLLHGPIAVFTDRLVLGGATAVIMAAGTGLISEFYEGHARLNMIARQGMSIELGGVIFLFIGGVLASAGWQWPFLLYMVAWALLAMVLLFIPKSDRKQHVIGVDTIKIALPRALKIVFGSAVLSMIAFFTGIIMLPLRLHELGFSEAQVGYFLSFTSLVAVGAAAIMPRAARKIGELGTLVFAFVFYGLAHLAFATADALTLMIEGGLCLGIGFGLSIPLVNHMTIEQSPVHQRGRNLAYLSMAIFAGQFLSSFMEFIPRNQSLVFVCAAVIALLAGVMIFFAQRQMSIKSES
ncbi:MFS transporter [Pseudomonas chlororaphis]|uniref:MFS transporter n=1 Tax=Pseudomonas chlororaphis TaxID=587753 RepID=UPI001926A932|nr:MFS transporter [Pseudomonas chlororaphis]QQX57450.1 MFS transporter [Pseudomonas chlororaphis subsp. aurantiaca]